MSDLRFDLTIGEATDDVGNQYSTLKLGDRVLGAIMNWQPDYRDYRHDYRSYYSRAFDLRLTLQEIPQPSPPPATKRTWAKDMGLRRPK